ncbi:E3 ubiquitin-protein ligase RSL1 [Linum grandiflorum]
MGQCLTTSPSTENNDQATGKEAFYGTAGPTFVCEICVETTPLRESFNPKNCAHFYCNKCTVRYIETELSEKSSTRIPCPEPGCEGSLDPEHCRQILPARLFDRWGLALVDSAIDASQKFYCPYLDCSVLLIYDLDDCNKVSLPRCWEIFRRSSRPNNCCECPSCKRKMCVKCKCPWHEMMDCETYEALNGQGEEEMLTWLAGLKKWRKCPNCKFYVSKGRFDCNYVKCRCGKAFCYACGSPYVKGVHVNTMTNTWCMQKHN